MSVLWLFFTKFAIAEKGHALEIWKSEPMKRKRRWQPSHHFKADSSKALERGKDVCGAHVCTKALMLVVSREISGEYRLSVLSRWFLEKTNRENKKNGHRKFWDPINGFPRRGTLGHRSSFRIRRIPWKAWPPALELHPARKNLSVTPKSDSQDEGRENSTWSWAPTMRTCSKLSLCSLMLWEASLSP